MIKTMTTQQQHSDEHKSYKPFADLVEVSIDDFPA